MFSSLIAIYEKKILNVIIRFSTNYKDVIISEAKDLHHPDLCLVTFGASPESTPPVQVANPDRAKRVSGRGVFDARDFFARHI
jgi:hypothetical protein